MAADCVWGGASFCGNFGVRATVPRLHLSQLGVRGRWSENISAVGARGNVTGNRCNYAYYSDFPLHHTPPHTVELANPTRRGGPSTQITRAIATVRRAW